VTFAINFYSENPVQGLDSMVLPKWKLILGLMDLIGMLLIGEKSLLLSFLIKSITLTLKCLMMNGMMKKLIKWRKQAFCFKIPQFKSFLMGTTMTELWNTLNSISKRKKFKLDQNQGDLSIKLLLQFSINLQVTNMSVFCQLSDLGLVLQIRVLLLTILENQV